MAEIQTKHRRKLNAMDYVSGGRKSVEIDRAGVLLGINAKLTFTVTNGSSAAVGPLFQTLARLIQRMEIIVGGRDTVWSVSGTSLAVMAALANGYPAYGMDSTVVLTGSSTATTYTIVLPIDFTLPNSRRPDDTALDLRRVSQATMAVTWGPSTAADFYTTPNSAAISGVSLELEGEYLLGVPAETAYLVRAIDETSEDITATNNRYEFIMDRGTGLFYRSFTLITTDALIGADDVINDVTLQAGSFTFVHTDPIQIKAANKRNLKLESLITGVYYIDESLFGQGVTWLNTGLLTSDLKFLLDVTMGGGTTTVKAIREAIRPLNLA